MTTEIKLGSKHECPSCGTKFYDLGKSAPVCPSCGSDPGADGDEDAESKTPRRPGKKGK